MMGRFRRTLNHLQLKEIELIGRRFTRSNERSAPTLVRLDRAFCTAAWETIFPDYALHSTTAGVSDHCPLVLSLRSRTRGRRRFHFENFWPQMDGFYEAVQGAWDAAGRSGCPMERLAAKFLATSRALQGWSQRKVGNVNEQLQMAKELLHRMEIAQDLRVLSAEEAWLRRRLKQHALALTSLQRTIARQRSRIQWLGEGDATTEYFFSHARHRKRKNYIVALRVDDRMVTSHEEKEEAVWDYYNTLLGTAPGHPP